MPPSAAAIEDHYKPLGPSDQVPHDPVTIAVALADKIDTLTGFWAIDEKPTGSKDPYALRRAALGVIRLLLDKGIRLETGEGVRAALHRLGRSPCRGIRRNRPRYRQDGRPPRRKWILSASSSSGSRCICREHGARHDLIDAVFALPGQDDLVSAVRRVEALGRFLDTEDGANLLAGFRRAANILRIEEKKDGRSFDAEPDLALIQDPRPDRGGRRWPWRWPAAARKQPARWRRRISRPPCWALSTLRAPVDAFFEKVTVNAEDPALRDNRLRLLQALRPRHPRRRRFLRKIQGG